MDDIQPNTGASASMGGPVNELGAALPQQQPQQQAPVTIQADPAQVAQAAHDSAFGRMAKTIMGMDSRYSVGPDGTLQNSPVQEAPGSFFRKLLGASLLGGAAGAGGDPRQGFVGGLVRGGAAGVQQAQQVDQQKQQQAQQDFADQQKVQTQKREQTMMNAQLQQMHSEQVARQHTSDLQDQAAHDKHNAASAALVTNLTDAGGTPAVIAINGKASSEFTAPELAAAYVKDPSILKAPQGYMRAFVDTTDSSNLTFNGHNWIDDSGNPVNMTDKTTVKAIDVPIDAMKTKIPTLGKDGNAAYGGKILDPDKTYPMSPNDLIALNSKRMSEAKSQAAIDLDKHKAATADFTNSLKLRELNDKEREQGTNAEGIGPEQIADAIHNGRGTLEQMTQGMGKESAAFRRQVTETFLKKYPESLEEYKNYAKIAETPQVQSQLTNARSIFGMDGQPGSFDVLETAIQKVPKSVIPILTKGLQKTAYQLGSPEMAEVNALKTDLSTELAKFNTGGGNATSDTQIEHYRQQLNEAQTPEQVDKVLKDIRAISSKRLGAIVGKNPYLHNLTKDINDPVTKTPLGGQPSPQNGQPTPRPGEVPVVVNGQTVGFTMPGKSGMRPIQ